MRKARWIFVLLFVLGTATAKDKNKPQDASNLSFVVLKDDNGKPVRNASVVLHQVNARGDEGKGGLQLKTDAEGKAFYAGIPYGTLRIQVIAPGFQTYGEDHEINQPEHEFVIRLKRPQEQRTIY